MCVQYLSINEIVDILPTKTRYVQANIKDWTPFDVFLFFESDEIEARCSDLEFVNSVRFLANQYNRTKLHFTKSIRCVTINLDECRLLSKENYQDIKERYGYKI